MEQNKNNEKKTQVSSPRVRQIPPHGGDIYAGSAKGGPYPLDFSANISPLGLPEGVRRALIERVDEFKIYPDPRCRELTGALSEKHGIPPERIACGAGSADLIFRIARVLCPPAARSLVTAPAFSEYEKALQEAGSEVSRYPLTYPGFEIKRDILGMLSGLKIIFLCNPNNPTGLLTAMEMIEKILYIGKKTGASLVVDECFMDLTDDPDLFTAEPLLKGYDNLIILKAFTKNFAMAGLRLGYALFGSTETAKDIRDSGPPWSVSVPAQIAGIQALKENEYMQKLRKLVRIERERLINGLSDSGLEVIGGSANYVFFRAPDDASSGTSQDTETAPAPGRPSLYEALAKRGILIRDCSNFAGLEDGSYYRIAVRLPEENERLLNEIKAACIVYK